jgi:hypothetical protein
MMQRLEKLISIGGPALAPTAASEDLVSLGLLPEPARGLVKLLGMKNGFYAFESALHVCPIQSCDTEIGLFAWNASDLWRNEYQGLADDCLFFAEDIFGVQFCAMDDGIHQFDPETGARRKIASDLEGWAAAVLGDYEELTGYPLAHEWQLMNGAIAAGLRLVPKIPFVGGGRFEVSNLYPIEAVQAMRFRASLAVQIRDLPEGARVQIRIVD